MTHDVGAWHGMLIERADERDLTKALMKDAALWSQDALTSARGSVVHDAERTARLLAAWAQVIAAGTKTVTPLFADTHESWARLGADLATAADQGLVGLLEKAARRCATDLEPQDRAKVLARLATGVSPLIRLAGGLDDLLEAAALHRACVAGVEAGWLAAATWIVCALSENAQNARVSTLAADRVGHLIDAGRGADLWHTWSRVAASMMSTAFLKEMAPQDVGLRGYPAGLWQRAVEAVHASDDRQIEDALAEFRAQQRDIQSTLCFELAMAIAAHRALPSSREARRAAGGERDSQDEALRSAVGDVLGKLPDDVVERTGRMHALSRRAVLAYIDADRETLAAVVDRVATWDDDPGRRPYSLPRFRFAARQALSLGNDLLRLAEESGVHITNPEAADLAAPLVDRHAPHELQQGAQQLLAAVKTAGKEGVDFDQDAAESSAGLVAFAALAAGVTQHPRLRLARERVRLNLIKEIRESEAKALRIPDREMVTEVSDVEALAFLEDLYGPDLPLPRDPHERAVWEHDIVAIIQQHLLEWPADATSPQQRRTLDIRIKNVLRAAAGTLQRTPPDRSAVVRKQPKKSSKRKRKGK
ncbi:hypothetical protein [Streptomyces millisiae]|uniref:Uncharacterized protein n=1 Tax=Streptomyces millisiae TaxID=3075542 RepID=A0ABU2M004_9ACTN|nr:hypothetical protein [Streptomyces sp. DSM 44918]MDT0323166.1 hypothetical protein [Streptomyces sp. DSM 44918]